MANHQGKGDKGKEKEEKPAQEKENNTSQREDREVIEKEKEEQKPWQKEGGGWWVCSAPGKGRGVFREGKGVGKGEQKGEGKRGVGRGDLVQHELPLCCVLNDELVLNHCDSCFQERFVVFVLLLCGEKFTPVFDGSHFN